MTYNYGTIEGRLYRYSTEKHTSGAPASVQYRNAHKEWRDVKNQDRIDQICLLAVQEEILGLQVQPV